MLRTPCLMALCLAGLTAQEKIDARCFMVPDFKNVVHLDLAMMRKVDVWDDLQASALKLFVSMAEKELGFEMESLDRMTMTMSFPKGDQATNRYPETRRMVVLEGNAVLPPSQEMVDNGVGEAIGDHTIYCQEWSPDEAFVSAGKLQVWGAKEVIVAGLRGERKPGLPSADVMSLSVGRGKRLAYVVADLSAQSARRTFMDQLFEGVEWPEGDAPSFVALRVLSVGDEDDPHLVLEGTMRHDKVGEGVAVTSKALTENLAKWQKIPQLRLMKKVLKGGEIKTSGSDVQIRFDLGRSRNAVGNLALLVAPMMVMESREMAGQAAVQVIEVIEEEPEEPEELEVEEPPPPPPPEPKPEGGGGND